MPQLTAVIDLLLGKLSQMEVQLRGRLLGFAYSSTHARPARMFRNGRGADNRFFPHHRLFHRCTAEDIAGDRLIPSRINYKNTSVNWSKYSKAWDVIFDYKGCGIVQFLVKHLPRRLPIVPPNDKARIFAFAPVHEPLDVNYSHSEIGTFVGAERLSDANLSSTAKKEFRAELSDRCMVLWLPKPHTQPSLRQ